MKIKLFSSSNKNKVRNKKNRKYIPLKMKNGFILNKNTYKKFKKNEYSQMIKLNNLTKIKNLLALTDYFNRYKLIIDINQGEDPVYYLLETVIASNEEEAKEKFKIDKFKEKIILNEQELIDIFRNIYRDDNFEINGDAKKQIAPDLLKFKNNYFRTDKYFGIVSSITHIDYQFVNLKSIIKNIENRALIAIDFKRINESKMLFNINEGLENDFKNLPFISYEKRNNIKTVVNKLEDALKNKSGIILFSITAIQLGKSEEIVKKSNTKLSNLFKYNGMQFVSLLNNQKRALNEALPYGIDNKETKLIVNEKNFLKIIS